MLQKDEDLTRGKEANGTDSKADLPRPEKERQ